MYVWRIDTKYEKMDMHTPGVHLRYWYIIHICVFATTFTATIYICFHKHAPHLACRGSPGRSPASQCPCSDTHTKHIHTYIHACMHTYIHTYTHSPPLPSPSHLHVIQRLFDPVQSTHWFPHRAKRPTTGHKEHFAPLVKVILQHCMPYRCTP